MIGNRRQGRNLHVAMAAIAVVGTSSLFLLLADYLLHGVHNHDRDTSLSHVTEQPQIPVPNRFVPNDPRPLSVPNTDDVAIIHASYEELADVTTLMPALQLVSDQSVDPQPSEASLDSLSTAWPRVQRATQIGDEPVLPPASALVPRTTEYPSLPSLPLRSGNGSIVKAQAENGDVPRYAQSAPELEEVEGGESENEGLPLPPLFPNARVIPPPNVTQRGLPPDGVGQTDDGRFTFQFNDAPWRLVLSEFARRAKLSLQMLSEPAGTVNLDPNEALTPDEALDALNSHLIHQGHLLLRNGRYLTVVNGASGVPAALVTQIDASEIDKRGQHEYFSVVFPVTGADVTQVSKELQNLKSEMGQIIPLVSSNHLFVADIGDNVRRIRDLVMLDGTGLRRLVHRVVPMKNATAEEVAKALNAFLSNAGSVGETLDLPGVSNPFGGMQQQIAVVAEPTTNSVLLRGEANLVAEFESLAREIDIAPREVIIHALLVEVELGNVDERGVELGFQDSVLFNRSVVDSLVTLTETVSNPGTGLQTTNQRIISQTSTPGFAFNNAPLGNNTSVNPSRVGAQGLGNLGVGRTNGDLGFGGLVLSASSESISVLIRALAANFNVDILSRPQIRTIDDHEAQIQIGQQVPVVDGVTLNSVGSANPVIRQDNAGIILTVTPHIGQDGSVTIDAEAEKSQFNTAPGTGVVIFSDATSGNTIEAPIKNITTAKTTVTVKSGETIVLGGMITEETVVNQRKVPYLGDLPYLGIPFRYDMQKTQRKELLIFLSPFLIDTDADEAQVMQQEVDRTSFPYEAANQIHGTPAGTPPFGMGGNWNPEGGEYFIPDGEPQPTIDGAVYEPSPALPEIQPVPPSRRPVFSSPNGTSTSPPEFIAPPTRQPSPDALEAPMSEASDEHERRGIIPAGWSMPLVIPSRRTDPVEPPQTAAPRVRPMR